MTGGNAGMTREALKALIGRTLGAETREAPPPVGEEGDWLYGSAGFTEPDEHGWMAPLPFLLAVVDGLKGFPEAITAVFPEAVVQTCIVHLLRNSMDVVSWKDRKGLATALKEVYRAPSAEAAEQALSAFEAGPWGTRYPAIGQSWRRAWAEVIPFFAFPDEVRRIIYTTNAIEALNSKLRRAVRARGHFPSDEAATKLLYLILNRSEKEWRMPPREWTMAKAQFAVIFGERFIRAMAA